MGFIWAGVSVALTYLPENSPQQDAIATSDSLSSHRRRGGRKFTNKIDFITAMSLSSLESCNGCGSGPGGPAARRGVGRDKSAGALATAASSSSSTSKKRRIDNALDDNNEVDNRKRLRQGGDNNGVSRIVSPPTVHSVANIAAVPSAGNAPGSGLGAVQHVHSQSNRRRRKQSKKKKKKGLPEGAVTTLNEWLVSSNSNNPYYPTQQEKDILLKKTGISRQQLESWFGWERVKKNRNSKEKQGLPTVKAKQKYDEIEKEKNRRFKNITALEERVNALEDNATKQKLITLIGPEKKLISKWSIETDLLGEAAEAAAKLRRNVWNEVFLIEQQAKAAKKKQQQEEISKWSIGTDLLGEAAEVAAMLRRNVWDEVFLIEQQAKAAKKKQQQEAKAAKKQQQEEKQKEKAAQPAKTAEIIKHIKIERGKSDPQAVATANLCKECFANNLTPIEFVKKLKQLRLQQEPQI